MLEDGTLLNRLKSIVYFIKLSESKISTLSFSEKSRLRLKRSDQDTVIGNFCPRLSLIPAGGLAQIL